HEENNRKQEEQARHAIGDRRVHDAWRDQQVEQQNHGEGQHEIGKERKDGIDPSAVIAGRQAQRDTDHQCKAGGGRRDDEHDLAAVDHAGEHVTRQLVASEQEGLSRFRLDGAWKGVLHHHELLQRIEGRDRGGENRRKEPEQANGQTRNAYAAVVKLPVETQLLLVVIARHHHHRQGQPDRPEAEENAQDDVENSDKFNHEPSPLLNPDTRIEERISDVGDELGNQDDQHRNQRTAEQQVNVVVARRLDQRVAEALVAEHDLDDHDAGQQPRKLQHDDGKRRDECIAQRVLDHDGAETQPLEPGGA